MAKKKKQLPYGGYIIVENPSLLVDEVAQPPYAEKDVFYINDVYTIGFYPPLDDGGKPLGYISFPIDAGKTPVVFTKIIKLNLEDLGSVISVFNEAIK